MCVAYILKTEALLGPVKILYYTKNEIDISQRDTSSSENNECRSF